MGRSQVARNQRRGRPGETGRGRGGATTTSTTTSSQSKPKHQVTGDNSFRYQDKSHDNLGNNQEEEEWDGMIMGGSGNYGPSHDFVQIASLQSPVEELFDQEDMNHHPLSASIDVMQLAKCLNKLDRSIWMRMSDRITDIYDDQLGKRSGEVKKMTLSEMNACPTPTSVVDSVAGAVDTLQVTDDIERVDTIQKEENDKAGSDDGEDLEDWLDGMIE